METSRDDPRVTWAVAYMQRAMRERIGIRDLAKAVNLSASRFTHLFAAQTGVPPTHYLQRLRLHRARLLIERTFLSVKEVMVLVGYSDPSHFARDFRRRHGMAPNRLRERAREAPLRVASDPLDSDDEPPAGPAVDPRNAAQVNPRA
jgi:transcriptional regulator GlxA family with amidase domain